MPRRWIAPAYVGWVVCAGALAGGATILDSSHPSTSVDGVVFTLADQQPHPGLQFLGLQDKNHDGVEAGFNTASGAPMETKSGGENLMVSDLQPLSIDSGSYFEFMLNTTEPQGGGKGSISLDRLEIFVSDRPADLSSVDKVYDLDATGDHSIVFSDHNNGQGKADLLVDIPAALIESNGGKFLTLYSLLGETAPASGGPEAWSAVTRAIPEPSLVCLASVIAAGVLTRRRK
jgi:hypothetical protein